TFTMGIVDRNLIANFVSTGSSGGGPASPVSNQEVKLTGTGLKETTLQATIDQNTSSAKIILGNLADNILREEGIGAITVPPIPGVNSYSLAIPAASLSGSQGNGALAFKTEKGSITISENMLSGMLGASGKEAGIEIGGADKSKLPAEVREMIGDRPVVQLSLTLNGAQAEWNNPEAPVTVSLPYKPSTTELAHLEQIVVWYIDGSGNAVSVPNGHYDPVAGTVTFVTTHFSYYAIGYHKVSFKDVPASAWYGDAVSFIAARGITTGTGNGNYSPKAKLTRGDFIVMMMKAYSIAPDADPVNNFADGGNTYYTGYLAAAKRLGITDGVGNNKFAPGKQITRQEMFSLLYSTLKSIGQLPEYTENSALAAFSDADQIASWAKDAMTLFVETGTISGSGDRLSPKEMTNRVQMAQVLYNLLSK
ncbi:MAG TPA: S-layer homology domain-containing protein, partial [Anaerovoracaceae bacterium]|nr:S-layer homology domain-containing protein [Anaerovoracaceae bacterium]